MANQYKLFDELNQTNHVCLCSENACPFCIQKIHVRDTKIPNYNTNYIAPFEVVVHNKATDIWVSFLGRVFDLTGLVRKYDGQKCVLPLIAFAGKDISHWFDEKTEDIRHFIHPITGVRVPYCPYGSLPDVAPQVPTTKWKPVRNPPWWKDMRLCIGLLTKRVRPIRIKNMLTREECSINVCCEDTLYRILQRYAKVFDKDASSSTWLCEDRVLDMNKTLEENGIVDERDMFSSIGLPENTYVPLLMLYYNDDMKWDDSFDSDNSELICGAKFH